MKDDTLEIAKLFHDLSRRLAPQFGYETRKNTREFDPNSPNGKLMLAVVESFRAEIERRMDIDLKKIIHEEIKKYRANSINGRLYFSPSPKEEL